MNKRFFKHAGFALLLAVTIFTTSKISHAASDIKKIKLMELRDLLAKNKGKVVILDLWATWCPPCRKEIPGFINLYNKYKNKGLEIIGIAFDENGSEMVPPFVQKVGINYPIYLDGGDIAQAYDLHAYPTTIIYGKDGREAKEHIGYAAEKEFEDEIGKLLKK